MINWKDLSVSKKLYCVVGIMALLIAAELFTLLFAMNTLSAVRSFVGGEGLWSKAQKTALRNLQSYALTKNPHYYDEYLKNLQVPLGDRQARLELSKESFDPEIVRAGFLQGRIHEDDIDGLIKIIRRFHNVPHLHQALMIWAEADTLIDEFMSAANELHKSIQNNASNQAIEQHLSKIYDVDTKLTHVEDRFSYILGEGSRWLERALMLILIFTIVVVEGSGLFLTFRFSQNLNRSLSELNEVTTEIGKRNFDARAPVRSKDELGELALAINKMADDLKSSLGQRAKAMSDSQSKTIFLANMSHEIRTPVGIILGFADLLKDPSLSLQERENHLNTISKTGNNLLRIINDILDISRVESGHIDISPSTIKLAPFMDSLHSFLRVKAKENKNTLIFNPIGKLPEKIITDETRLHQILLNLVSNGLKFTENGKIELSYWVTDTTFHFEISDTGPGIDESGKERLFQMFSQVTPSTAKKHLGSGLGLVLSKRLAHLLGGNIYLKNSELGKGTTFAGEIQFKEDIYTPTGTPQKLFEPESFPAIEGKNILVVDDSEDNQLLIKIHLTKAHANISMANNGQEAIDMALSLQPDLILMDIQMPVKDGYVATKELRSRGFTKPIIALTANAMIEDRNRCLEAGCTDYITKPIVVNHLYATLSKYLS